MVSSRPVAGVLALAACLAFAAPAWAGPPDRAQCIVDHVIIGSFDTRGAPSGPAPCTAPPQPGFDVWVRDGQGNPVPGAQVSVQFAGSGTGIRPFLTQNSGVTVNCQQNRTLSVFADASGHAVMVPRFGGFSRGGPTIPVYANGQFLIYVEARSPDYDQDGVISLADFARFSGDYAAQVMPSESDFDDCPGSTLGDFLFFAEQYLWDLGRPSEQLCN